MDFPTSSVARKSLVSVVVPCYNVAGSVLESLNSALAQTYPRLEIICVDDGSTDDTLAILRQAEAAHPEVRVLTDENRGAPAARNRGLGAARGQYIQFLDADDLLKPGKIAHQMALITRSKQPVDLVIASWEWEEGEEGKRIKKITESDPWSAFAQFQLGNTISNLWRKEFVQKAGGWSEEMPSNQEYELMYRMLKAGANVVFDEKSQAIVRRREGSISTRDLVGHIELSVEIRRKLLAYLSKNDLLCSDREKAIYQAIFGRIRWLYTKDPEAALALHHCALPGSFVPPSSSLNSALYAVFYRLFGFRRAEETRRAIRKLLPS